MAAENIEAEYFKEFPAVVVLYSFGVILHVHVNRQGKGAELVF